MVKVEIYKGMLMVGNSFIDSNLERVEHAQATITGFDKIEVCIIGTGKEKILDMSMFTNKFRMVGNISHRLNYIKKSDLETIKTWFKERNVEVVEIEV